RLVEGERRKKGIAAIPKRDVKISFLLERSTRTISSGVDFTGKPTALVGHMALHV
ncbi:unnamed protein product, partial [marine sediment metagenome]